MHGCTCSTLGKLPQLELSRQSDRRSLLLRSQGCYFWLSSLLLHQMEKVQLYAVEQLAGLSFLYSISSDPDREAMMAHLHGSWKHPGPETEIQL